jgi:hypothetical protein
MSTGQFIINALNSFGIILLAVGVLSNAKGQRELLDWVKSIERRLKQ